MAHRQTQPKTTTGASYSMLTNQVSEPEIIYHTSASQASSQGRNKPAQRASTAQGYQPQSYTVPTAHLTKKVIEKNDFSGSNSQQRPRSQYGHKSHQVSVNSGRNSAQQNYSTNQVEIHKKIDQPKTSIHGHILLNQGQFTSNIHHKSERAEGVKNNLNQVQKIHTKEASQAVRSQRQNQTQPQYSENMRPEDANRGQNNFNQSNQFYSQLTKAATTKGLVQHVGSTNETRNNAQSLLNTEKVVPKTLTSQGNYRPGSALGNKTFSQSQHISAEQNIQDKSNGLASSFAAYTNQSLFLTGNGQPQVRESGRSGRNLINNSGQNSQVSSAQGNYSTQPAAQASAAPASKIQQNSTQLLMQLNAQQSVVQKQTGYSGETRIQNNNKIPTVSQNTNHNMLSMFTTQSQTSSKLTSSGLAQTHGKIGTDDYSRTQSRASSVNAAGPSSNSKPENNQSYPLAQNFNFNSAVNESIVSKSSVYGDQYTTTGLELADQQAMSRLRQSADSRNRSDQVKSNSHQDDSQYRNNLLLVAKNPISISTNPTRNEEKQFRNSREDQLLSRPAEVASQSSYNRVAMSNTQSRNNSTLQTTQSYSNTEHEYQKNKVESDLQMVSPCAGGGTRNTPTTTGVTSSQQQKTIYQTSNPIGQESINSNVLHSKSQAKHRYEVLNKILKHQKNNTNDEGGAKSASGKELADTEIVKHQMDAVNNVLEEIMSSQTNKYDFQALRLATDFQQRQAKADKYLLQDRMAKMQRDRELGLKREKLMAQEIKSLREQLAIAKASKAFDESPIITPQIQADQRRSVQGTYTRSGVHQETLYSSFPPQISVPASQKLPDLRSSSVNEMRKSQLLIPKLDLSKVKGQFDKKNPHQTIQPKEKEEKPLFMNKKQAMRSLQATTDSIDFQKSQPFTPCDGVSSTNESMNSISKEIPDVKINTFKNEPISKSFKSYSRQASASMEQIKSKETGYPSNNSNTPYTGDQRKNKDQISAVRLKEGDSRNNVGDLKNVLVGIKHFEAKITAPKQSGTQATTLSGAPSVAQAQPMANYLHESISSPQHEDKGKGNSVKYMHEMQTHSSFDRASHVIPKKHGDAYKTIDVTQQSPFSSNTSNLDRGNNNFTLQGNYTQNPLSSHNTSIDSYVASVHINDDKLDRQGRFSTVDVHGALANRKRSLPPVKIPILDFTKLQSNVTQSKKMNLIKKTLGCKSNSVMIQQSTSQPIKNMTAKQALIQQLKGF